MWSNYNKGIKYLLRLFVVSFLKRGTECTNTFSSPSKVIKVDSSYTRGIFFLMLVLLDLLELTFKLVFISSAEPQKMFE